MVIMADPQQESRIPVSYQPLDSRQASLTIQQGERKDPQLQNNLTSLIAATEAYRPIIHIPLSMTRQHSIL